MPFDENPTVEITDLGGDNTGDRVKFTLRNCELPIANALRRVMIAEVSDGHAREAVVWRDPLSAHGRSQRTSTLWLDHQCCCFSVMFG